MIQRCEQLYQDLLNDLRYCQGKGLPFLAETEYCFYLAEKYRGLLREELNGYSFPSVEEEIHFFKNIRPKFIAQSEYFSLLNYAGNFCPSADPTDERNFWIRQSNRLEKFRKDNKEFYDYYSTGSSHLDIIYYTASSTIPEKQESNERLNRDYGLLAGQLMARERYVTYATRQLELLQEKQSGT